MSQCDQTKELRRIERRIKRLVPLIELHRHKLWDIEVAILVDRALSVANAADHLALSARARAATRGRGERLRAKPPMPLKLLSK
jgi:hypothetical protein